MTDTRATVAALALSLIASARILAQQPVPVPAAAQPPPRFQAGVDVLPVDVTVVDGRSESVLNLGPGDFSVRVDGSPRRVLTAEWVSLGTRTRPSRSSALPEGYSSNEQPTDGRLIVLAVDQLNIRSGGGPGLTLAVEALLDRLSPDDRFAAVGFGAGALPAAFTADREQIRQAIARMNGQAEKQDPAQELLASAALNALAMCNAAAMGPKFAGPGASVSDVDQCRQDAFALAPARPGGGSHRTFQRLRDLLTSLAAIDGPKTLVLMSEGFAVDDRSLLADLDSLAALARTSIYVLRLDEPLFDARGTRKPTPPADQWARRTGLEMMSDAAHGTYFNVSGPESDVFQRIAAGLSGYYLLGVESVVRDGDGKPHPIRVDVERRGVTVRSRQRTLNASAGTPGRSPQETVIAGLTAPLPLSTLPIRVTAFALKAPGSSQVSLQVHADVGAGYTTPTPVSIGILVSDREGRPVSGALADMQLSPKVEGVGSPLRFVGGLNVAPGEYTLKLAVADGVRVGTVEHAVRALLGGGGGLTLSDLMVGGPAASDTAPRPTADYAVAFGRVHGYLEAYGPQLDAVKVKYEIASTEQAPALVGFDVVGQPSGDARIAFSGIIPVPSLPPGKYVLRAVVSAGSMPSRSVSRAFEIALPVPRTTATGTVASSSALSLPFDKTTSLRSLRQAALAPAIVGPFVQRLRAGMTQPMAGTLATALQNAQDGRIGEIQIAAAESSAPVASFLAGLTQLERGDLKTAVASFQKAVRADGDSVPGLAYLAVCYAASGHDTEATGAWQAALIEGSDLPQIYDWLGEALLRADDPDGARSILEEALGQWPEDSRFARLQALLHAKSGNAGEAVRALERYVGGGHDDPDTLFLASEWMYRVHAAGAVVRTRAEDLVAARAWADAYVKAGGPKLTLVKQWLDFLEREGG